VPSTARISPRAARVVAEQNLDGAVAEARHRQRGQRGVLRVEAQDVAKLLHEGLLPVCRLARVAEQPQEEL
jgi:hypothetical protein